jgi:hypothetical protein
MLGRRYGEGHTRTTGPDREGRGRPNSKSTLCAHPSTFKTFMPSLTTAAPPRHSTTSMSASAARLRPPNPASHPLPPSSQAGHDGDCGWRTYRAKSVERLRRHSGQGTPHPRPQCHHEPGCLAPSARISLEDYGGVAMSLPRAISRP